MKKNNEKHLSVVFNISTLKLNESMEKVFARGLNFSVLPGKLDITQVLVDWKRFERAMKWKEWWFGKEHGNENKEHIFKSKKTNLPKNHT